MVRRSLAVVVAALVATTAGCTMCCHPYDYCGPVYEGRYATGCNHNVRAGSAFSGTGDVTYQMPSPAKEASRRGKVQTVRSGIVPGSERIISVTERTVEPSAVASNTSTEPADTPAETSQPMPIQQWTAKRSTGETVVR